MDDDPNGATTDEAGTIPDDGAIEPDAMTPETADDVALVRAFVLASDPAIVPELVTGGTVPEVLASVAAARAAFARVVEQVRSGAPDPAAALSVAQATTVPIVPAGGAAVFAVDPATLPAGELIRRGISAARRG